MINTVAIRKNKVFGCQTELTAQRKTNTLSGHEMMIVEKSPTGLLTFELGKIWVE